MRTVGASLPDKRRRAMAEELGTAILSLYMRRPSATADEFRQAVQPIVAKHRAGS